jgi:hypothetical protein
MNIKSINATQINNIIIGCYSLFPVAGAVIADSFFSSFYVVSVFAFVSLLVSLCSLQVCMHNGFFFTVFSPLFFSFEIFIWMFINFSLTVNSVPDHFMIFNATFCRA